MKLAKLWEGLETCVDTHEKKIGKSLNHSWIIFSDLEALLKLVK